MAPLTALRVCLLVFFSAFVTVSLGFGLPVLLNAVTGLLGVPEASVSECVVVSYLLFVLYVATPRIPRGLVEATGKAVFLTSCDSNFGLALAQHLHKLGFTVFAGCSLRDKGGESAKILEDFHSERMKVVQLDVSSNEQVNRAAHFVRDNLEDSERGLWALVNNASVSTFGGVEFTSMEAYKEVSEINLWGTIRVTKALLPLIRRAKGRVVNMSGLYGRMGNIAQSPVSVSKYGMEAFFDCLRYEMKSWGIKVSVVEPGNFAAEILSRDVLASAANKQWAEASPDVRDDYGKARFDQIMALIRSQCNGGQKDVGPLLDAMVDAVMSKHPYTRYNAMEPYWWIRLQLMTHLPTVLSDLLYF
ncbi:D-beta-hydroxybutyrate dehydrogenase, mitochondrial isoform X1 [Syngnathus typhle]|uniref:D-beta-hydroxybutyrate dehydrogenase, mitochondrial isoform X1 n=1 Tax=Syngnathus typhle TaxID=161592 RepID=UPI002A6AD7E4|nr:D-beta-hydroxybutyrate dehydrogenase, mitochondrial isoform X1 [Syngnathus typhle]